MLQAVITTIQSPTSSVIRLAEFLAREGGKLVIAGDTKGPDSFDLSSVQGFAPDQLCFLDIDSQMASPFTLAPLLPTKHYCRKNLGYLHAISDGASCLYETDDDNAPLDQWKPREEWIQDVQFVESSPSEDPTWVNVYRHFTKDLIWPRGLPLDQIQTLSSLTNSADASLQNAKDESQGFWAPIQQGLADGAPDVDAIWRLVLDREFDFDPGSKSVLLAPGQWCPFNTQTTWWWPEVYPLLYVPSYCSFRMCDIWKSFVAQRCLWERGTGIVFHPPEVVQERNPHNLMRDFDDEIPGYQQNHDLARTLESVNLESDASSVGTNLRRCYEALVAKNFFPEKELALVDAWLEDVTKAISSN